MSTVPKVVLLALGGTIAAVPDPSGRAAAMVIGASAIAGALPGIAEVADIHPVDVLRIASAALSLEDVVSVAAEIGRQFADGADGVVVTQGTDSLEEVAFMLDLLVGDARPVVVTGAMRNSGTPGADGSANLLAAVRVAASPDARGLGTLVVMLDQIHAARFARKVHATSPAAFSSPSAGPIGWITEDKVRIPLVPRDQTRTITAPDGPLPRVALVRLALGDDGALLRYLAHADFAAAVVEVFGAGHVSPRVRDRLHALNATMPVVFATRTGSGELHSFSADFPGSEVDLLRHGLISAGRLDGLKARLVVTLVTAAGGGREDIAAMLRAT